MVVALVFAGPSMAQSSHHLTDGNSPPGLLAQQRILSNPSLAVHTQPVQIIGPQGCEISLWSSQGISTGRVGSLNVGLSIGQVYRMRVSNVPRFETSQVYPSIEILDRLNPPEGMENQFPIKIVITQDDLEKAIAGKMVTRVIYLENPNTALPYRQQDKEQASFDVGSREDPLRTAESMGRPMAIVRMGSRVPLLNEATNPGDFDFFAPTPTELPAPQKMMPKQDYISRSPVPPSTLVPTMPAFNDPPIVTRENYLRGQDEFRR